MRYKHNKLQFFISDTGTTSGSSSPYWSTRKSLF